MYESDRMRQMPMAVDHSKLFKRFLLASISILAPQPIEGEEEDRASLERKFAELPSKPSVPSYLDLACWW